MTPLLQVVASPSGFDSLDNYLGETDFGDFECLLTRTRDSDVLTESNWESTLEMLGGEGDTVRIDRFGHWACGWWEAMSVKPHTPEHAIAEQIEDNMAGYPVLDEQDLYQREATRALEVWGACYNERERIEYIRNNRPEFNFCSFGDLRDSVRGKYFGGDDSAMAAD